MWYSSVVDSVTCLQISVGGTILLRLHTEVQVMKHLVPNVLKDNIEHVNDWLSF